MAILRFHLVLAVEILYTPIRLLILLFALGMCIYGHIKYDVTFKKLWSPVYKGFCSALQWEIDWVKTGKLNIEKLEEELGLESCE